MKNPLNSQGRHRAAADGSSAAVDDLPLPGYDRLNVSQIIARLPRVSQVELTAVDHYERAHANRIDVLNKLRYLRGPEPVDGYDVLGPEEIVAGLRHADNPTLKRVREYELKFRQPRHRAARPRRRPPQRPPRVCERRESALRTGTQARRARRLRLRQSAWAQRTRVRRLSSDGDGGALG
jgi:hypothetical protein